jgi:hypothetical protein
VLSKALAGCGVSSPQLSSQLDYATQNFLGELSAASTFQADLAAATVFGQDAKSFDILGPHKHVAHLCTPRIAVYERGIGLASKTDLPDPSLVAFYRGLFTVVRTAAKIAPHRDSLDDALYDLRLMNTFGQARDMLQPSALMALMERYATTLLGMPQQIDRLLEGASAPRAGGTRQNSRMVNRARRDRAAVPKD